MKFYTASSLLVIIICILLLGGCSEEKDASTKNVETKKTEETKESKNEKNEKRMDIGELMTATNIKVDDHSESTYGFRNSWTIEQIDKMEVITANALKNGPFGGLIYNIWYGQDDLTTLKKVPMEGLKLAASTVPPLRVAMEAEGMAKAQVNAITDAIQYYSSNEETSYRTIKVISYGVMGEEYDVIPYGYFKEIVNQTSETKITVYEENGEWVARGGYDLSPTTQFIRTGSGIRIYSTQGLKSFEGIETPDITSTNRGEADDVTITLSYLVYDIYLVLAGKEPETYPEYAKALVESFNEEEKNNAVLLAKDIEDYSEITPTKNYLPLLKWGMGKDDLKKVLPEAKEEISDTGEVSLSLKENRYASTSCVESDTVYFHFTNEGLNSISYRIDMNQKCNMDDPSQKDLVKKGYKELYDQVISEYDPTNKKDQEDLYNNQEWENQTSQFKLAFWVALDINPPTPYAEYTITKKKDNVPVVLTQDYLNAGPPEGKKAPETSSKDWTGEWSVSDAHSGRFLEVSNQAKGSFDFLLNATNGGNTGMLEGTANFSSEGEAEYPEDDIGCEVRFVHNGDHIEVTENEACDGYKGAGVGSFNGKYPKGGETNKISFSSIGMLPENIDKEMKNLTGSDYERFIEWFNSYDQEEDLDGVGATVLYGFVPGVATSMNGVIMYKNTGEIWAAYLDGLSLNYYTNVVSDSEALPESIKTHYEDNTQLTIHYLSK